MSKNPLPDITLVLFGAIDSSVTLGRPMSTTYFLPPFLPYLLTYYKKLKLLKTFAAEIVNFQDTRFSLDAEYFVHSAEIA